MSMLVEVSNYLKAQGLAGNPTWPLSLGYLPAWEKDKGKSPRAVALFAREGGAAEVRCGVRYPELGVQVRGEKHEDTFTQANLIFLGLNGKGEPPDFPTIRGIDSKADIASWVDPDNDKPNCSMRFEVMMQQ